MGTIVTLSNHLDTSCFSGILCVHSAFKEIFPQMQWIKLSVYGIITLHELITIQGDSQPGEFSLKTIITLKSIKYD